MLMLKLLLKIRVIINFKIAIQPILNKEENRFIERILLHKGVLFCNLLKVNSSSFVLVFC